MGARAKSDLKVHVVWIPKYGNAVAKGDVAVRVRDLVRLLYNAQLGAVQPGRKGGDGDTEKSLW